MAEEQNQAVDQQTGEPQTGEPPTGEQQPAVDTRDYEAEATLMGWKPEEQWDGPPSVWRTAKEYVERGEELMPMLRHNNRNLLKELREARERAERADAAVQRLVARQGQQDKAAYERARREILEQQRAAAEAGDLQAYDAHRAELDSLETDHHALEIEQAQAMVQPVQTQPQTAPELDAWMERNAWYNENPVMRATTDALSEQIKLSWKSSGRNTWTPAEFLAELDTQLRREMPNKFGGNTRGDTVATGGQRGSATGGHARKKTVADLPPDARDVCKELVAEGTLTEQQYLDLYFEGEE